MHGGCQTSLLEVCRVSVPAVRNVNDGLVILLRVFQLHVSIRGEVLDRHRDVL